MGKREMNEGLRDSITSFKNIKITEGMIYLADQILAPYWLAQLKKKKVLKVHNFEALEIR